MTEQVIIEFVGDFSKLESGLDQVAKSGKVDVKAFNDLQSAIDTTASDTQGLIKQFKEVGNASIKMGKSVEDAFGAGIQDALDEAGVSLKEFEAALKKTTAPATSVKKELMALKNEMARLKAEGKDTGKEFDAISKRAGQLSDAVSDANAEIKNAGSDTRGLDNVVGSISAVAGGFAVAQGAVALFGDESEDLQRALLKVNGAMALATGLQQVYNATLKEGSLRKLADVIGTKAQSAALSIRNFVMNGSIKATEKSIASTVFSGDALKNYSSAVSGATNTQKLYETAVKSSTTATVVSTTATTAATQAARVLRIALIATGIGLIVVLLIAAADAMGIFGGKTEEAADKAKDLADGLKNINDELDMTVLSIKRNGELQLEYLKQKGVKESEIFNASQGFIKQENSALLRSALQKIKLLGIEDLVRNKQDADNLLSIRKRVAESKFLSDKKRELLNEEITALQEVSDAYKKISDNEADITLNNEQFKTKTILDGIEKRKKAEEKRKEAAKKVAAELKKLQDEEDEYNNSLVRERKKINDQIYENEMKHLQKMRQAQIAMWNKALIEFKKSRKDENDAWVALDKERQASMAKSSEIEIARRKKQSEDDRADMIADVENTIAVAERLASVFSLLAAAQNAKDRAMITSKRRELDELLRSGAITEKAADKRRVEIEQLERAAAQRAAQREKQLAVFQAVLAIPKAFLQGLSQGGIYLAAIYAALAAVEAAVIISQPVPKFFRGKKDRYEGPGDVADQGSEIVERNGRMFLYTKPTRTYLGATDKVYTNTETKKMLHNTGISTTIAPAKQEKFDYNKFAKAIPVSNTSVNIDKDFISEAVASGLSKNNYFSKRYQFKK